MRKKAAKVVKKRVAKKSRTIDWKAKYKELQADYKERVDYHVRDLQLEKDRRSELRTNYEKGLNDRDRDISELRRVKDILNYENKWLKGMLEKMALTPEKLEVLLKSSGCGMCDPLNQDISGLRSGF